MYYSAIGFLAILVLFILNYDILFKKSKVLRKPAWKVYKRFLFAVLAYYVTDVLWGVLEGLKLSVPLFADTTVYFIAMALGVLFWAEYTVEFLENKSLFGRILICSGFVIAGLITVVTLVNIFLPVLFTVDGECVYTALPVRYVLLAFQIAFLLLISIFALSSIPLANPEKKNKSVALALFGLIMAVSLFAQMWFPLLPLYAIGYLLGTCLLHTFVVNEEKDDYRVKLEKAYEKERSIGTVYSHLALSLARGYTDLYYVNMETDEFVEYRTNDDSVVLTEARRGSDFFEGCERDAKIYVQEEDREAFVNAMNRNFLMEALDRGKVFELTYRRLIDGVPFYVRMKVTRMADDNRFIVIGVSNIDEQIKQRRTEERMKEERVVYERLHALTGNFIVIYVVDPETDDYREFASSATYHDSLGQAASGINFFETVRVAARVHNHPDDLGHFLSVFTKENVMAEIERSGIFSISYRLLMDDDKAIHVRMKAAMVEENGAKRLIVGINDIDAQVRQEAEYGKRLAKAQTLAKIDALTGVKNKHAYLETEASIDHNIAENRQPPFAIVMMDVNDLKKVNDTYGHQAGDQYLQEACRIICDTFKHSPVFRIGGDEFTAIVLGNDYASADELIKSFEERSAEAVRSGGVVIACGMAKFDGDTCVDTVFDRADHKMYENKTYLKSLKQQ
ncbi:MAG: GGDEF domain-containing protein [Clostridia bacterium]|nr:GGDEF domain-containing protein [Clostridia bacterium]